MVGFTVELSGRVDENMGEWVSIASRWMDGWADGWLADWLTGWLTG